MMKQRDTIPLPRTLSIPCPLSLALDGLFWLIW